MVVPVFRVGAVDLDEERITRSKREVAVDRERPGRLAGSHGAIDGDRIAAGHVDVGPGPIVDFAAGDQVERIGERGRVDIDVARGGVADGDRAETVGERGEFTFVDVECSRSATQTNGCARGQRLNNQITAALDDNIRVRYGEGVGVQRGCTRAACCAEHDVVIDRDSIASRKGGRAGQCESCVAGRLDNSKTTQLDAHVGVWVGIRPTRQAGDRDVAINGCHGTTSNMYTGVVAGTIAAGAVDRDRGGTGARAGRFDCSTAADIHTVVDVIGTLTDTRDVNVAVDRGDLGVGSYDLHAIIGSRAVAPRREDRNRGGIRAGSGRFDTRAGLHFQPAVAQAGAVAGGGDLDIAIDRDDSCRVAAQTHAVVVRCAAARCSGQGDGSRTRSTGRRPHLAEYQADPVVLTAAVTASAAERDVASSVRRDTAADGIDPLEAATCRRDPLVGIQRNVPIDRADRRAAQHVDVAIGRKRYAARSIGGHVNAAVAECDRLRGGQVDVTSAGVNWAFDRDRTGGRNADVGARGKNAVDHRLSDVADGDVAGIGHVHAARAAVGFQIADRCLNGIRPGPHTGGGSGRQTAGSHVRAAVAAVGDRSGPSRQSEGIRAGIKLRHGNRAAHDVQRIAECRAVHVHRARAARRIADHDRAETVGQKTQFCVVEN